MSEADPASGADQTGPAAGAEASAVEEALVAAHHREWARVLASTVRVTRDLDLAEECVQEAYAAAWRSWPQEGIPAAPAAWLTTTARRRGVDAIRRAEVLRGKLPLLVEDEVRSGVEEEVMERLPGLDDPALDEPAHDDPAADVPDERLRLVFLCCHPALNPEAQAALTLRLVCGVPTADIARLLLVTEATMAARITRAKRKITGSGIAFRLPAEAELPDRLQGALAVVYLVFTAGHLAPSGADLVRDDLAGRAVQLARMLRELMPDEPEVSGMLALILVHQARRDSRVGADGGLVRLPDQDRSVWDHAALAEAEQLITSALRHPGHDRYTLQAAIASLQAEAPTYAETDWRQILVLYDVLLQRWPSPVVALNRAVALAEGVGPAAALVEVQALNETGQLAGYRYLPAVEADLLRRLGRTGEAATAYRRALELTDNDAERRFLDARLAELSGIEKVSPR